MLANRSRQGDAVSENKPFDTPFVQRRPVAEGRIKKLNMNIYADRSFRPAPIAEDDDVALLCHVEADVSHIPENLLQRRKGKDGQLHYELSCKIEAVYLSASTQYTMIFNGQRYNSVTAEYV
jgi:hypothetical protein